MRNKSKYSIERSPLFGLGSRSKLARLLRVSNKQIRQFGGSNAAMYSEFVIPKPSGGEREIEDPARQLKDAQRHIAKFLARIEPGKFLFCPVRGKSYIGNAAAHIGGLHVHCLDIHKFFPSVTARRVFWFFNSVMCCTKDIAALLTAISTYKEHLPTGSPLSPIVAYYAYFDMWQEIEKVCIESEYNLTVYVDDITISSSKLVRGKDIWRIKKIIASFGLRYHKERDYRDRPAIVTGCVVVKDKVLVPFSQYKKRRVLQRILLQENRLDQIERLGRSLEGLRVQMKQVKSFAS